MQQGIFSCRAGRCGGHKRSTPGTWPCGEGLIRGAGRDGSARGEFLQLLRGHEFSRLQQPAQGHTVDLVVDRHADQPDPLGMQGNCVPHGNVECALLPPGSTIAGESASRCGGTEWLSAALPVQNPPNTPLWTRSHRNTPGSPPSRGATPTREASAFGPGSDGNARPHRIRDTCPGHPPGPSRRR